MAYNLEISSADVYGGQKWGNRTDSPGSEKYGQQFTIGASDIVLAYIDMYLFKTGSPTDNATFRILLDSDRSTVVASTVSIAGTALSTSKTQTKVDFESQEVTLSASTTYFLECARSSGVDASNYYNNGYNDNRIAGAMSSYYSSSWHDNGAGYDLAFDLYSVASATDNSLFFGNNF